MVNADTQIEAGSIRYAQIVEAHGLSDTHRQVIEWVPKGSRVLEIGCSTGYIGKLLREEKGCTVTGLEADPVAASKARANGLTVIEGSAEDAALRESIEGPFDIIIAADVLEHLANPPPVLEAFKQWLAPHGRAIIAVPNIATWHIRCQLFFRGDFEYQESGFLDRTHLHFFTWNTLHKLVRAQKWNVEATMIEGFAVPGLQAVLVNAPLALLAALDKEIVRPPKWMAFLMRRYIQTVLQLSHWLTHGLARIWPNLCAPHIALLLRDAESGTDTSSETVSSLAIK